MKKFICILICGVMLVSAGACAIKNKEVVANTDEWIITTGGKKYEATPTGAGTEYYTDGKVEDTKEGISFSGKGGFYSKEDGKSGAACGGVYNKPIKISDDGFKVEFTIDEIGHKNSTNAGGNWDSWFAFGFVNKAEMFNTITDTESKFAQGYIFTLKPFAEVSAKAEMSILVNEKGKNWTQKGDNPQEENAVVGKKHTYELKKESDELGVFYKLYFDAREVKQGGNITEKRFKELFPTGEVYFQFYQQNWNALPKASDTDAEKEYKNNKFTVHSIASGSTIVNF